MEGATRGTALSQYPNTDTIPGIVSGDTWYDYLVRLPGPSRYKQPGVASKGK